MIWLLFLTVELFFLIFPFGGEGEGVGGGDGELNIT